MVDLGNARIIKAGSIEFPPNSIKVNTLDGFARLLKGYGAEVIIHHNKGEQHFWCFVTNGQLFYLDSLGFPTLKEYEAFEKSGAKSPEDIKLNKALKLKMKGWADIDTVVRFFKRAKFWLTNLQMNLGQEVTHKMYEGTPFGVILESENSSAYLEKLQSDPSMLPLFEPEFFALEDADMNKVPIDVDVIVTNTVIKRYGWDSREQLEGVINNVTIPQSDRMWVDDFTYKLMGRFLIITEGPELATKDWLQGWPDLRSLMVLWGVIQYADYINADCRDRYMERTSRYGKFKPLMFPVIPAFSPDLIDTEKRFIFTLARANGWKSFQHFFAGVIKVLDRSKVPFVQGSEVVYRTMMTIADTKPGSEDEVSVEVTEKEIRITAGTKVKVFEIT